MHKYELIRIDEEVYAEIKRLMEPGDSPCSVLRKIFDLPPRNNARKDSRLLYAIIKGEKP